MNIGLKIKETIDFNNELTSKIFTSFSDAILEAKKNGVDAAEHTGNGSALMASIDNYQITISLSEVINELNVFVKRSGKKDLKQLNDDQIKNVVNNLIIKHLSL